MRPIFFLHEQIILRFKISVILVTLSLHNFLLLLSSVSSLSLVFLLHCPTFLITPQLLLATVKINRARFKACVLIRSAKHLNSLSCATVNSFCSRFYNINTSYFQKSEPRCSSIQFFSVYWCLTMKRCLPRSLRNKVL